MTIRWMGTAVALRTVSEALAKAACQLLEIEAGELMAEFRPSLTPDGMNGFQAEIFLYDTLSGGAGFATQLPELGAQLFQRALEIVKECPENCDASCYRCLRSYKNKFEHSLLDRHVGAELLEYLINGVQPQFDADRLQSSTELLYRDLLRQSPEGVDFTLGAEVGSGNFIAPILATKENGERFIIALSAPLAVDQPADPAIASYSGDIDVIVENELVVRGNLPAATRDVLQQLGPHG